MIFYAQLEVTENVYNVEGGGLTFNSLPHVLWKPFEKRMYVVLFFLLILTNFFVHLLFN